jgi:putative endonuclease
MSRVSDKPYFVYVLWSETSRRFYIGITENLAHRLAQHNEGLSAWTSRYRPWALVYQERKPDYGLARRRENELKRQKGGSGFFRLTAGLGRAPSPRIEETNQLLNVPAFALSTPLI